MAKIVFWCLIGPAFLLAAAALLFFPFSLSGALSLLISLAGIALVCRFKIKGLCMAIALLAAVQLLEGSSLLLSFSIAISWFMLLLGQEQVADFLFKKEEKVSQLEECKKDLEKQLRESERFCADLSQKGEALAREKEMAFQAALDDAHSQLLKMNKEYEQEEATHPEYESLRHQHLLLREQFEEKSAVLDNMRKALFQMETELLLLQKERVEELCADDGEFAMRVQQLQESCAAHEEYSEALCEALTFFMQEKKEPRPRKRKAKVKNQESLPLMIQDLQSAIQNSHCLER